MMTILSLVTTTLRPGSGQPFRSGTPNSSGQSSWSSGMPSPSRSGGQPLYSATPGTSGQSSSRSKMPSPSRSGSSRMGGPSSPKSSSGQPSVITRVPGGVFGQRSTLSGTPSPSVSSSGQPFSLGLPSGQGLVRPSNAGDL